MNITNTKNCVQMFLKSDDPEVLVIKGVWGVGKTYSWKNWLIELKEKSEVSKSNYSYVSLFGVKSITELKTKIYSSMRNIKDGNSLAV
ncbi:hypothetical protein K8I31_22665 [bacterium]|nr:hypothetical protein [bacterium]